MYLIKNGSFYIFCIIRNEMVSLVQDLTHRLIETFIVSIYQPILVEV